MAKVNDDLAIVVGSQTSRDAVNETVRDATAGVANDTLTDAQSVLFDEDSLSLSFERSESTEPVVSGSFTKRAGYLQRIQPAFSFTTNAMGGARDAAPSGSGDWDLSTAQELLYLGAGLTGTSDTSDTDYALGNLTYLTFKVWRGSHSWTFPGCFLDPTWNFTPGEKATITWTVLCDDIVFDSADPFPTSLVYDGADPAGGQQTAAPPVLKGAEAEIAGLTRGFQSGTLSLSNQSESYPDSNAANGVVFEQTGREIRFQGDWYADSAQTTGDTGSTADPGNTTADFYNLESDVTSSTSLSFTLGTASGASTRPTALSFSIPNYRYTAQSRVDSAGKVVWGLDGYATSTTANAEMSITAK